MTQWGLDNLFNPGKRHMDDEKRRLQSTREEIGDASGGRRIDLEGGTVSISVPRRAAADDTDPDTDTDADITAEAGTVDEATADDGALPPVLEAEQEPEVALANDEAEIVPEVVESVAAVEAVATEPAAEADPEPDATSDPEPVAVEPGPAAEPEPVPEPEPVAAAPRRRTQSARAWSRGG